MSISIILLCRLIHLHFAMLLVHSAVHLYFNVFPGFTGFIIVGIAYILLPLAALRQLNKNSVGRSSLLLALAGLSGAFIHGLLYHFVIDSPDYVCYFGAQINGHWFRITAWGMAIVDGLAVAAIGWKLIASQTGKDQAGS